MTKLGVPRKPIACAAAMLFATGLSASERPWQSANASVSSPRSPAIVTSASSEKRPLSGRKPSSACFAKRRLAYSNMRSCSAAQEAATPAVTDSWPTTG